MRKNKIVKKTPAIVRAAGGAAALLVSGSAYAQTTYEWNTAANGNWDTASLWTPTAGPGTTFPIAGDTAVFNAAGVNGAETINLNGAQAAASLSFKNTGTTTILPSVDLQQLTLTSGLTLDSGAGAVSTGSTTAGQTVVSVISGNVNVANNSASTLSFLTNAAATTVMQGAAGTNVLTTSGSGLITFAGSIVNGAGTMGLVLNGPGTVDMAGSASSFGGGVAINGGTLALRNSNALGTTATTLTVNGGTIQSAGATRTIPAAVSLSITNDASFGGGGTNLTVAGAITFGSSTPRTIAVNNPLALTGAVDLGGANQTFNGAGNLTFSGNVTNGSLTLSGSGTVDLGGSATPTNTNSLTGLTVTNGVVIFRTNATGGGTNQFGPNTVVTLNGGIFRTAGGPVTTPAGVSMNIIGSSQINNNAGNGITWGGTVSFTGASPITLTTASSTFSVTGTTNLGGQNRTINPGVSMTFAGAVSNGGIIKTGAGTLHFLNTGNTYSGDTVIMSGPLAAGTSAIGGTGMLSPNSRIFINTGGSLEARLARQLTIPALSDFNGAGGAVNMGTASADQLSVGTDNTNTSFAGIFSGTDPNNNGGVLKVGTGTLTLTGNSTFNGFLWVRNGAIEFNSIANSGTSSALFQPGSGNVDNTLLPVPDIAQIAGTPIATIHLGYTTTTGILRYIGTSSGSSSRGIDLAGTTGGATIDASSPGNASALNLSGTVTATGTGAKTLTLTGSSTADNTIGGNIPDATGGGAISLTKSGTGKWVLAGANTYTGATTVNAGTLAVTADQVGSSAVNVAGGSLELSHTTGLNANGTVVKTGSITIAGTGAKIDVKNNKMVTADSVSATIDKVQIGQGTFVGAQPQWNGDGGIVTSETDATTSLLTTVAVVSNADLGKATFGGVAVSGGDTLVMYTYGGDANLDGHIDADDYFQIDSNNGKAVVPNQQYFQGDFNYDGVIDGDDFAIIDANYAASNITPINPSAPAGGGVTAVPEPASLGLLLVAGAGLLRRRRRS